jgi:hypothetical protein
MCAFSIAMVDYWRVADLFSLCFDVWVRSLCQVYSFMWILIPCSFRNFIDWTRGQGGQEYCGLFVAESYLSHPHIPTSTCDLKTPSPNFQYHQNKGREHESINTKPCFFGDCKILILRGWDDLRKKVILWQKDFNFPVFWWFTYMFCIFFHLFSAIFCWV